MEFEEKVTVRQFKRILQDPNAPIEERYGTAKETIEYCKKDNNFMEFGKPKAQGERNDLSDVYESLKVGRSLQDNIEEHSGTYIRYLRGIERVQDFFRRKQQKLEERVQPTVIVYVVPSLLQWSTITGSLDWSPPTPSTSASLDLRLLRSSARRSSSWAISSPK